MRKSFLLTLLLALSLTSWAQFNEKLPIDSNVRYGKLDNGLTYYIRHNAYPEKRAEFYIAQKVGSMQEEDSQRGLAHFLEHMAFNGTKNYPDKTMLNYLETIGAKFGVNVNAYTSFDETVYNLSDIPVVREGIIDSCLLVLHDWSSFISLQSDEIDNERPVIKEEWRTRGNAQMRIFEKQLPIIFEGSKYAYRYPIGTMEVVENFDYQTLKDYYHKWYRPDLQAIIIVGDVDVDQVEGKIKAMFADIAKPVNPAERTYFPVENNEEPIIAVSTDPENTRTMVTLYIKHDVVPENIRQTQAGYAATLIQSMASRMLSDRLAEISKKADAPFAASYAYDGNYFVSRTKDAWTALAVSKEGMIDATLATLIRENERVKRFGFTDSEVERAKATLLKNYEDQYNNRNTQKNSSYVREYVSSFTENEPIPGIEYEYNLVKQVLPMLNANVINQYAKQIISDKNNVVAITGPQKEGLAYPTESELLAIYKQVAAEDITAYAETVSNEPLISKMPKAGKVVKIEADKKMNATVWTLSNGMRVVLKKTDYKDDQILMSSIAYGGNSIIADKDIPNIEMVSAVPYIGGIGNFSSTDLKKALAGKSASVNPSITAETQGFSGSSSIKDFETLLQLTYLYFTAPRKDQDAYTSLMAMVENQLKNRLSDPSAIFGDSISSALYNNHPRMKAFNLEDFKKLDYDRVIEIYKEIYANPGSFVFTFVGTVNEQTMKPLVEQYLASLPAGNKNATYVDHNCVIAKGHKVKRFEQAMETPKVSVYDVYSGTLKNDQKTKVELSALKQILDIVYVETIREKEGGTYGVSVSSNISRVPMGQTTLAMNFDTNKEKVDHLNPLIDKEVKSIAHDGPRAEDFQKVKEYMLKKYQEDIRTNEFWSRVLSSYFFYKEDNYSTYLNTLNALSPQDVKAVTKALLDQNNTTQIIMLPKE